ncbi:MAG TPA: hypothetical protein VFZ35_07895 [Sphingomicrobium sp.]
MLLSLCCQPTWAGALIGAGTALVVARFAFLQPFLLGAAVLLAAGLFWLAYRPGQEDLSRASRQVRQFRLRVLAWVTAAVLAAFVAVAQMAPMGAGM